MKKRSRFGVLLGILLAFSVFSYLSLTTVVVSGNSMLPTFKDKQRVLVCNAYWLVGPIREGDVVVIREDEAKDFIIKRIHRLAGGTVEQDLQPGNVALGEPYVVPPDTVYVLGDNREVSQDSREFGPVDTKKVIGKVIRWQ
jgi:signal peptidase I